MSPNASHEIVIVGGGVSGLVFAHECAKSGRRVLVLEKNDGAGGCLRTERLPGGFWFELGAHACYNSYGALLDLLEARGARERIVRRRKVPFRLFADGGIHTIASQLKLLELICSAPRLLTTRQAGRTVEGFYGRLVGRRNFERVFAPLLSAVPSQDVRAFPANMLFKKRARRRDIPRSYTFNGGLSTVIDVLAGVPGVQIQTNAEAIAIEPSGDELNVTLANGRLVRARRLCLAVPPPAATTLLAPLFPALAELVGKIGATRVETVGVVVRAAALRLEPVLGIVPLDRSFFSAVSRDPVPDAEHRAFSFHFGPGGDEAERMRLIGAVLGVPPAAFVHVAHNQVVLPSPALGHAELIAELERRLAPHSIFLVGNYFGGLSIEDCVLRAKHEHSRLSEMRLQQA